MPKSEVYDKFVSDDRDLVGLLAYSIYQRNKVAYIDDTEAKSGVAISELELATYRYSHSTREMVDAYYLLANEILNDTIGELVEASIESRRAKMEREFTAQIHKAVKPLITPWWHNVLYGILSAFVFAVIAAAFAFIKASS